MASLLDSTCLLDTPLTAKDVRVSARINGPCNSCAAGKFMSAPSRPSTSTPSSSPGQLLHADIAFFQEGPSLNRPYLVVVDDFSGFCFCRKLQSKSAAVVADAVEAVISEFKAWGHPVAVLRTDFESVFRSLKTRVNALGTQLQHAAPGAHEKRVEIQVRYLRNRFEVIKASLPFNIPTTLYGLLLCDLASSINALPNSNMPSMSPVALVTGRKTSLKEDLKFQFGAVVIVASPEETVASGGSKGVVGIVVGKEPSVRGACGSICHRRRRS
jgi:hypothetical protein